MKRKLSLGSYNIYPFKHGISKFEIARVKIADFVSAQSRAILSSKWYSNRVAKMPGPSCSKAGQLYPADKSLPESFNLRKYFSISSCTGEYAHSNHSLVGECTKTLDNI